MSPPQGWSCIPSKGQPRHPTPRRPREPPTPTLARRADAQAPASATTNVVLRHDGAVRWDAPAITRSSCRVDVSAFPFDAQHCGLTFGSWTHGGHQLDVRPRGAAASLADFVENVEWRVLGMPARRRVLTYGCCSEPYPDVTFTLLLRRRAAAYVCNLLLPCVLISLLAPLAFHLPADSGEKVSLGVTVLLALTVFQLILAESMPPAESVPLIGGLRGPQGGQGGACGEVVPHPGGWRVRPSAGAGAVARLAWVNRGPPLSILVVLHRSEMEGEEIGPFQRK